LENRVSRSTSSRRGERSGPWWLVGSFLIAGLAVATGCRPLPGPPTRDPAQAGRLPRRFAVGLLGAMLADPHRDRPPPTGRRSSGSCGGRLHVTIWSRWRSMPPRTGTSRSSSSGSTATRKCRARLIATSRRSTGRISELRCESGRLEASEWFWYPCPAVSVRRHPHRLREPPAGSPPSGRPGEDRQVIARLRLSVRLSV